MKMLDYIMLLRILTLASIKMLDEEKLAKDDETVHDWMRKGLLRIMRLACIKRLDRMIRLAEDNPVRLANIKMLD
jgi:hypothetical protein